MSDQLLSIHQPPREDLAQIAQIADWWSQIGPEREEIGAFRRIVALVRAVQEKLGEPNAAAIRAAALWASCDRPIGSPAVQRGARDCAAAVIAAQLRGPAIVEPQ